jgi:hypothetical protein
MISKTKLSALAASVVLLASTHSAISQEKKTADNWCDKPIDWAVKQGSRQFTKAMVKNLSREAQRIDKSKSAEQANVCIITGLQKRRLPYEF